MSGFTTGRFPGRHAPAFTSNPLSRFRNTTARTFFSRRDQAIVGVQVSTGLRISETFGLRLPLRLNQRRGLVNLPHIRQ